MEAISVQKVQPLIRCLDRLYNAESLMQFPSTVFSALSEIIEGGVFLLDTLNLKTGEVIRESSDDVLTSPKIKKPVVELVTTSPAIPMVRQSAKGAIRLTDCKTLWQFGQTSLYADLFIPMGVRRQTVVSLDIPGHVASITVKRDSDFTDEETLLLGLTAPHVALAHRNLQRLESFRAAAAPVVPAPQDLQRIGLTPREAEVLLWVMKGKQDGAIADILEISVRTVHHHIAHILKKLQSESRASAGYEAMIKLKGLGSYAPP